METEHTNGVDPQAATPPGEHLLATLEALAEDLTPAARLAQYQMLRPELVELYELDHVAFDLVIKAIVKKLKVKAQSILRDIKEMVPPAEPSDAKPEQGNDRASQLVALAHDAELWHTPEGDVYATIPINGHKEHWLLGSKNFHRWLRRKYYEQYRGGAHTGVQARSLH